MSSLNQSNGKKCGSGSNSTVNTPASTPVTSAASASNGQTATQTSPPPNNNAPKYGTLVPNRIFVGGISANTTESELVALFNNYGTVKAAKIIQDRAGVSKGYGFITFESEEDAKRLQREADNIVLRERKLNIAPAIKKQPFSRAFDASSPPAVAAGNPAQYYFQPGTIPYFQSGVAYYPPPTGTSGDPNTQQPSMYQAPSVYPTQSGPPQTAQYPPVMFPAQPIYMPQQYPMPMPYDYNYYTNGGPQYMVGGQGGPQSQVPPMQRPGSPPRPPCYGQQLPFNPEAMYYNVPMYGTMEGPTLYQDTLDMANGAITEDCYTVDDCAQQDLGHHIPPVSHLNMKEPLGVHEPSPNITDTTRQSNTPVVSLLSLDQHQEKDFTSMQSGRRRKSTSSVPQNNNNASHNFNGYTDSYPSYYNGLNVLPNASNIFGSFPSNSFPANNFNPPSYSFVPHNEYNNYGAKFQSPCKGAPVMNGQDRSWARKRRSNINEKRNFETSSLSSLRTDSNSSASVADDNRNEDKTQVTSVSTPPPPPYSPMANHGIKIYNTKSFQNTRSTRGGFDRSRNSYGNGNPSYGNGNPRKILPGGQSLMNNKCVPVNNDPKNSEPVSSVLTSNKPSVSPFSQVHPGSQHFIPPARRNRRSVRRNTTPISEIGAGDAPLPNADVSDTCKKLDSLKL